MFAVHIQYKGTGPMDRPQQEFFKAKSRVEAVRFARLKLTDLEKYRIPGTADIYALNHESTLNTRSAYSDGQLVE
mgnify:CR=1 FL=1